VIAIFIFFWAVKDGQYDDLDSAAINILLDDDIPKPTNDLESDNLESENLESDKNHPDDNP